MSPREKAAKRGNEIEDMLQDETLSADKRNSLERELVAIGDNMAEGCYSNDPDDGIDWSDCPGISVSPEIVIKTDSIKFYTPPMDYRLHYLNDDFKATYDDYIPADIIDAYRDKVSEALKKVPTFYIEHPDVSGVKADVEVHYGMMHGTLEASLNRGLTQEKLDILQEKLKDLASRWSVLFETFNIMTDGGTFKFCFYNGSEPLLEENLFIGRAYVDNCLPSHDTVKFYKGEGGDYLRMVYYNPDADSGGQLVNNILFLGDLHEKLESCENVEKFWGKIDEDGTQCLTDIGTRDFINEIRSFVEEPCDFAGQDNSTIDCIRAWVNREVAIEMSVLDDCSQSIGLVPTQ